MADIEFDLSHAGVERDVLLRHVETMRSMLERLDAGYAGEFLRLPHRKDLVREIRRVCANQDGRIRDVVQLGIGGSSLGARAICEALLPADRVQPTGHATARSELRVHFADNIDPESFHALLDRLDPRRTLVHVVSKSGGTLETAAQLFALIESFSKDGRKFSLAKNCVITTGEKGPLRDLATAEGVPTLSFPEGVGGRFSVLTASGLLAPALAGVRIERILTGARAMDARCRADSELGPAGALAALHFEHDRNGGRPIHVELIYGDALHATGEWFAQLWAESLGKSGRGPTPVLARGTTDQHSQIQLYAEGPDDKLYTFITVDRLRANLKVSRQAFPAVIRRRGLAEIFAAEARGTLEALAAAGRPVVHIRLPRVSPELLGGLLFAQELQTALAGALYDVDPFNQPGVEAGKRAALRILSS